MTRGHFPKSDFLYFSSWTIGEREKQKNRLAEAPGQLSWPQLDVWGKERQEVATTYHFCESPGSHHITGMDKTIEMSCGFFDGFTHLIVAVEVKDIGDKIERILVILHFCIQAGEVETVCKVVFIDLAEVFIAPGRYKLAEKG